MQAIITWDNGDQTKIKKLEEMTKLTESIKKGTIFDDIFTIHFQEDGGTVSLNMEKARTVQIEPD